MRSSLAHYGWSWGQNLFTHIIFGRTILIIINFLISFVYCIRCIDFVDRGLIGVHTSLRSEFITLRSNGSPSCCVHHKTFILKAAVINTVNNTSFGHYWVTSAYNVRRCSPSLLDRLIPTFHNVHNWVKKFLIFYIYVSLSNFFSLVS